MIHPRTLNSLEFDKIVAYLADLCISSAGRGLALATKPLADAAAATASLKLYEECRLWLIAAASGNDRFSLSSFPDVSSLLAAVANATPLAEGNSRVRPDLDAFWALREMLREAQKAQSSICNPQTSRQWPGLLQIAQSVALPMQLLAALNRCISDDGLLKDESSPELYRLRNEMRRLHQACLRKVRDMAQKYNMLAYLQDEFITLSSDRYVLPLKANFKGRMQGIIHDWSQTGETCYFEPIFLVQINNHLQELKHEEREEEKKILDYLTGLLFQELVGAQAANSLLALLDLLNAKKLLADNLNCSTITFADDAEGIELAGARHPLLALARLDKDGKTNPKMEPARPLDIVLRPGERVLVITGGNAGGKTVCLKTLGIIAAMAMSGLPTPVDKGSHLPWFERMDAFIGDEQSLDDNVSTFTAQIDHLGRAWKYLGSQGLALLDEFGAGTDPAEGAALAQAVLDGLIEKKCFVLAATHFPALKSYALTNEGVRAASMLFNPDSGRPLFKIGYDMVGSSQALQVAAGHGMPDSIIARARHYLLQDGQNPDAVMARLNELAAEREQEVAALKAEKDRATRILAEKREKLERERNRLYAETSARISELMQAWKSGKSGAKQTLKEMSGLRAQLGLEKNEEKSVLPQAEDFEPGQNVLHAVFNKRGVITDLDSKRQRARLDMDGVSLWAEFKDLRQCGVQQDVKSAGSSVKMAPASALRVDVRGMRADEAIAAVERFLDKAIPSGFSELEIVHGRGTGVLRRQIHDFLRNYPAVSGFALANEDNGGDGMTIVTLK